MNAIQLHGMCVAIAILVPVAVPALPLVPIRIRLLLLSIGIVLMLRVRIVLLLGIGVLLLLLTTVAQRLLRARRVRVREVFWLLVHLPPLLAVRRCASRTVGGRCTGGAIVRCNTS